MRRNESTNKYLCNFLSLEEEKFIYLLRYLIAGIAIVILFVAIPIQPLIAKFTGSPALVGNVFMVNTTTTDSQYYPDVAMDADGNFVVTWDSGIFSPSRQEQVFAQRYNSAGIPQGGEIQVSTPTAQIQSKPKIAMDRQGNFVIIWGLENFAMSTGSLFAQRFNSSGIPQGSAILVVQKTGLLYYDVAMSADGAFVVMYSTAMVQRYSSSGVPQGSAFQASSLTASRPAMAMGADGDFVVVWQYASGSKGIYARHYNSAGVAQSAEFAVDASNNNYDTPDVAMDADGDFIVTWYMNGLRARRYDKTDTPQGSAFLVTVDPLILGSNVAMDPWGNILIPWQPTGPGTNGEIWLNSYGFNGTLVMSRTEVVTKAEGPIPGVAVNGDGDIVVAFAKNDAIGYGDIYAQRLKHSVAKPLTAVDDTASTGVDKAVTIAIMENDDDPQNDAVISQLGNPGYGIVMTNTGALSKTITYTPTTSFTGTDTFTYTILNEAGIDTANVTIIVSANLVEVAVPTDSQTTKVFTPTPSSPVITMTLDIPAGAVSETVTLNYASITTTTQTLPNRFGFAGKTFILDVVSGGVLQSGFSFVKPITLTLEYDDNTVAGLKEETISLYYWDGATQSWSTEGITIIERDTNNNRLIVTISHLTEFSLLTDELNYSYLPIVLN